MIDIKDNTGEVLYSTPINKGSKRKFELMKDDYIMLKFTLDNPVDFPLGTYAECDFGRFEVVEDQTGTFSNTSGGYDYELKLEADYMKWRNKLFKYQPEVVGGNEASWSLTAPLSQHMGIFLRCLKAWGYKHGGLEYQYLIDETVTGENLYLTYSNTNLIDALTMMAEAAGCEWWVDGADIHFGRMADGVDPVTLELGDNAVSMTLSKSSGDYFTRIFAFGSTNNISPRYRKKLEFTVADGGWYDTVDGERCIAVVPDKKLEYGYFRDGACSSLNASKDFSPTDAIGLEGNKHNGGYVQNGYLLIQNTWGTAPVNIDVSKLVIIFNPTSLPCTFHTLRIGFDLDSVMNGTAEEFELNGTPFQKINLRYKYENVYTGGNLTLYYRVMYGEYDEDIPLPISASLIFSGSVKVETVYKRVDTVITMEDGTQCDAVLDPFYKGESELSVKNGDIHHSYFDDGKKFTLSDLVRTRLPIGYFDADVDGLTVNGVVQRRLMLPEGIPYVDLYEDMHPDEVIEGVVVFDYVFPGKTFTVSSVDDPPIWTDVMEEYTDEDGETQKRPTGIKVPTYTIRTTELAGFSQDYVIGESLTVTFQTGSLAGLSFGVSFLPEKSTDTEAVFQIVANEDYGGRLPDTIMYPKAGDTFVMAGYDTEYMFNDLTAEAEQRLYQETLKYKEKLLGNRGTVTASLFSDWSRDKCATDGTLHPLAAGGSVSIDNKDLFPAPVTMRVIGYELNLDIPFDTPQYTIGESPSYSRLGALESKIDSVSLNGSSYLAGAASSTGGGTAVKLIKTNDRTAPSDTNAYSAARTDKEIGEGVQEAKDYTDGKVEGLDGRYLSKVQEDRTWFPLHLGGGAYFGSYMAGLLGGKIDATGAAELLSLILRTGLESDNFSTGALGAGFCLKKDENGDAYIEVDRMLVRKIATFVQLMIQELKHVGGQIVLTPASMKCSRVVAVKDNVLTDADGEILYDADGEVLTDSTDGGEVQFYRCYFEATDGEKTINNEFAVGDQARCQTFNVKEGLNTNVSNTYYWRLVTGVGDDYIDLSATDCDAGSTAPAAGDEIVQLGHRTDATRQAAVILSAYGEDAPYIKMYRGISGYSLDGKEFFTASRTKVDITADTIRFRTGQSVEDAMAEIAEEAVKGVSETVDGLVDRLAENINYVNALSGELELVKKQADGAIESFFGKYDPTAGNEPASGWTTEEDKARHAKDTFTNISTGHSWSWVKDGDAWKWVEIEDTATTKALADAARAQDTADGKRRVFVATPTDASEYDPGDLWVNATYGDYTDEMLRCNTKKAAGAAWSISHWEKASKYTDDTAAKAAAKAAEEAAKEAKAANDDLAGFKSDSLISPVEKTALRQQMADIKSEYADTTANASRYGVSAAAYVTAYGKALAALEKYTEAAPEFIPVEADYADISAYYAARQSVLDDTAEAAKAKMDVAIKEVDVEYALGTSATTAPTSGWQTESPQWTEGKYIWQRTKTVTSSGTSYSKAVCIQGASGRGVAETDVSYQAGSSGTTPPAGSWSSSVPSVPEGQYLWTRTVISYNDGTTSTSYSVGKMGAAGKPGTDGDGIVSVSTTYQIGTSGTTPPTGSWSASVPSPQKGKYLWTRTVTTYKKGEPTTTYGVSYYGTDGAAAKYVRLAGDQTFVYSNNFSGNPTPTSIKLTATLTGTSGYQWSYKRASQSSFTNISGATSQTYTLSHDNSTVWGGEKSVTLRCTSGGVHDEMTVVKVSSGKNGTDGTDGKDAYTVILTNESHSFQGNTNAAIAATAKCGVIAYKGASRVAATIGSITGMPTGMTVSLSGNGTTGAAFTVAVTASLTTGQGTLAVPVTVDGKQFTKNFSFSVAFKGKGVSKITEQYYLSASSSTPTGGSWTYARPEWVKGKHIWTRSEVKWDDGTTTYTDPVLAEDINSLGQRAEQAITDAANAKSAADDAQADATEAKDRLDEWAADGVVSPVEKQGIKDEMARIDADKEQIADGYAEYSLGTPTAYNTSYANYRERLAALSASSPDPIKIPSDFASRQSAYYVNRASCLNAIAVAAKSYAEKVVAEIEMGGTNLVAGTINGDGWTADSFDEEGGYFFKASSSSRETYIYSPYIELETGRDVVLSFEARQDGGDKLKSSPDLYVLPDSYKEEGIVISGSVTGQYPVSAEWRRVSVKGHVPDTLKSKVRIRFDHNGTTDGSQATIYVRRVKLEYGTVATDWSPAPEDLTPKATFEVLEGKVNSIVDDLDWNPSTGATKYESKFEQTAKEISALTTKTTELGTQYSELNQTVDGITSTVSGLNGRVSTIEQTAEDISLKVDAIWPDNLWPDGSFEEGLINHSESGVSFTRTPLQHKFGERCLRLDCGTGNTWTYLGMGQVPVNANATYTLFFWMRANTSFTEQGGSGIYESKDEELTLSKFTSFKANVNTNWRLFTYKFTTSSSTKYVVLRFGTSGQTASRTLYVDGIMLFEGDLSGSSPDTFIDRMEDKLLSTGIDIENRKVTVTSDSFEVRNNAGNVTARVNENGLLQVGSGEFSGLIRQVPFLVEDAANDDRLTLDGENYIELKEENLVTGGFIVINQTSNSYVGQGINLPVGFRYAGTRIFIIKRWASLGNFTIRTVPEDLPDGYTEWREPSAVSGGELFRIRNKTAVAIWMGDSGSWDNEFVELVAMPKSVDIESGGRKAYGHVEWVVMNAWQWAVKSDGGRNVGYRQNGY